MQLEEIREYCLNKKGANEGFPFDQDTLVFKVGGKMFLLISLEKKPVFFNVKADPEYSEELRERYEQIKPAYHMNKKHWNSIWVDGMKKQFLEEMIDHSYDLVFKSLSKKLQNEIDMK